MAPPIPKRWTTDPEYIDLLNYLIKRTENVESPMRIKRMAIEFKEKSGTAQTVKCFEHRIASVRTRIHSFEHIDTNTKVKLMFALSSSVDASFLRRMRKKTIVEVDDKKRIIHFKANDGSLELRGDHSQSAKNRNAQLESKGSHRSLINSYFENKNDADAVPNNESESEMWQLIEFITEKCQSVDSPLSIYQLTKDFIQGFESSVFETVRHRIRRYRREIQKIESLDTFTKVKQLFGLGATLDSDYLEKLRKDAAVEVDKLNRITKYTSNNEDDSDEYSSEELGSEFDSDDEKDSLDEADHTNPSSEVLGFDKETPIRDRSPSEMSIDDNFDFNSLTERSNRLEETERGGDEENDLEITGNVGIKTRSERLSKRRHLDSEVSYNQENSISSEVPMSTDSLFSKFSEQKKSAIQKKQAPMSSNQSRSSSRSIRRSTRNSSLPPISTDSEEKTDNQGAQREVDFEKETSMRNGSPAEVSMDDNFDFDLPTEKTHTSEKTGLRVNAEKENEPEIDGHVGIKTRSARLSKRKHLDSEFSYNQANSSSSGASMNIESASAKPAKQKKSAIQKEQASSSSNQMRNSPRSMRRSARNSSFPPISTESKESMENQDAPRSEMIPSDYDGPRIEEVEDYDYNPREDNTSESSPIDNQIEEPKPQATEEHNKNNEVQNTDNRSDAVAPEPKPEKECLSLQNNQNSTSQMNGNEFISLESHIRLLDSLLPMMKTFETPTLDEDLLRIEKTIEKFKEIGNDEEKIRLNEIRTSLMTCLLIVERSAKKEIVKREDTTSLEKFLIVFQNFLFSLKLKELDGFVARVKYMMNELEGNDKKFPTKKIQFAFKSIIETIVP